MVLLANFNRLVQKYDLRAPPIGALRQGVPAHQGVDFLVRDLKLKYFVGCYDTTRIVVERESDAKAEVPVAFGSGSRFNNLAAPL